MTDRDIVERVGAILGRAVCRSDRGLDRGYKSVFITSIKGYPAIGVMLALRPALGRRRQAQIDRAVVRRSARAPRWSSPTPVCTTPMCHEPAHIRALCERHYGRWWKAKRKGRASAYIPLDPPAVLSAGLQPLAELPNRDPRSIAGLAGLLEGEGHFTSIRSRGGANRPVVQLQMCDEDVVRAAATLGGCDRDLAHRGSPRGLEPNVQLAGRRSASGAHHAAFATLHGRAARPRDRSGTRELQPHPAHRCAVHLRDGALRAAPLCTRPLPQALHDVVARSKERSRRADHSAAVS